MRVLNVSECQEVPGGISCESVVNNGFIAAGIRYGAPVGRTVGTVVGGALGSEVPIVGNVAGAIIGGSIGSPAGAYVGGQLGGVAGNVVAPWICRLFVYDDTPTDANGEYVYD